jgi:hypothetical protein
VSNTVLSAIAGGVVGGFLSGSYQHLREWHDRPRLHIDFKGTEANTVPVEFTRGDTSVSEIFLRARVLNSGRKVARACQVFLTGLTEVHPAGTTPTAFHDSMALAWAGGQFVPRDVPPGVEFYVDVVRISKHYPGWNFSVENLFASLSQLKEYKGTYRFHLIVTGDNTDPAVCQVDVSYAGDWHGLRSVEVAKPRHRA